MDYVMMFGQTQCQYEYYHHDYPWLVYDILLVSLSWDNMDGTSVVIET